MLWLVLVLLTSCTWSVLFAQRCTRPQGAPNCVCETEQGTIDLRPLYDESNPKFKDVKDSNGQAYTFNPCYGITNNQLCGGDEVSSAVSAVCQKDTNGNYRSCGLIANEQFQIDGSRTYLQYNGGTEGRLSIIDLICDESKKEPELTAKGDGDLPLTYKFDLRSKCACPDGCQYQNDKDVSGPVGITLIMLFFAGFLTYFIVGAVVLKYKYQKKGYDLIPQRLFWFALPGLVKEGCIFTFGPLVRIIKQKMGKRTEGTEKQDLLSTM